MIIRDTTEKIKNEEEIIASEKRYRRLFETAQDGILIIDLKSETIIDANKYLLKLTGYSLDATLDKHLWELGFIEDKLLAENAFLELRTKGYVRYENIPLRRISGEIVPVEFISNVYGVNGTSIVQCNIRDISERRSGFQREIEMTRIIDSASDAIVGKDLNGIVTCWNKGAEKIYGYTKDEIVGKSISLLAPSDSKNEIQEILAKVSRGEQIADYETTRLTKNGKKIQVSLRISPVLDDQGRIIGASTIAGDVSMRKLAEEKLGESEQRYRRLFETAQDGILILDEVTGKIVDANPFILEMTEYKLNELVGKQLWELGFIEDQKHSRTAFAKLKKEGYIRYEDIPLRRKNGMLFGVEFISNSYDVNGHAIIQCNIRDITDRKLIKDALLQTNRKLNLLSSITRHDINNQLMALEGNLALLDKVQFDKYSIDHLQKADAAVKRISSMIQFTKEYEDIGVKAPTWHKARELIENASKGVALGPIELANDIPADLEVYADPLITKVFHNLIDNAVRHGGKITTIRFYIEGHDGARYMICEDDGIGISSEIKDKLFTRNQGKDHGFGLFLSQEILLITGIVINEYGMPGKGARFRITVPAGAWHSRCLNAIHQRPDGPPNHQLAKMERFNLSIVPTLAIIKNGEVWNE